jgi:hypothetical protein
MKRSRRTDYTDHVDQLLDQAGDLPHGPTRVELCEEAVRIADTHNDPMLAYRAREELVEAACFGGRPDLLIVGFSWCLATFDRKDNDEIAAYPLLWRMKWVIGALPKFPEIELSTIHRMLDDMERRFRDFGGSLQPVVQKRRMVALTTGDLKGAAEAHRQVMRMSRNFLSDCHACELDALAGYWIDIGKNALGVRKSEELIASGLRCAKVPETTYSDILLPMVKIGRARDAMKYHRKGYPLIRRNVGDVWYWGQHMAYLSLTRNDARAVKLLETHLPDVEACHDPLARLSFLRNMVVVVEGLAEEKEKRKIRIPSDTPLANELGEYVLADLAGRVRARALELSLRFDRRNGNSHYEELMDEPAALRKRATRVPLTGPAADRTGD